MRVGAHRHFCRLDRNNYDYERLTPSLALRYRDCGPVDLAPVLTAASIDGTIVEQTAQRGNC